MPISPGFRRAMLACASLLWSAHSAAAQESSDPFYKGRQIQIVIGSSAGGGYDTYARLLARHFGGHISGNPLVIPQNMTGAGSNRAAGYVYSVAPKDGSVIGAIFPGAVVQPLLTDAPLQHDPSKLIYLGSANSDVYVCFVRTDAPVKTFEDVLSRELIVGASNDGATTRDMPVLLNNVLGAKFRVVTGYAGSREITLALERGEVQGACGIGWTGIMVFHPDWFSKNLIKVLVQLSTKGHPDLDRMGVPLAASFARSEEDRMVLDLVFSQGIFGRPFVLPPGVPAERVNLLRQAFTATFRDDNLRAEAAKMQLDVDAMSGEDLQSLVTRLYATPARVVERARLAMGVKPQR